MKKLSFTLLITFICAMSFAQSRFSYNGDSILVERLNSTVMSKMERSEPMLYRTVYWLNYYLDACQKSILEDSKPDVVGSLTIASQIDNLDYHLQNDNKSYKNKISTQKYREELAFYEKCGAIIVQKKQLAKEKAKMLSDSIREAELLIAKAKQAEEQAALAPEMAKQDSIHNLRHTFPHPYGTTFGNEDFMEVSTLLVLFLEDSKYMNLNLTEGDAVDIKGGFRNVYENRSGVQRLLIVDNYIDTTKGKRPILKKLVIHGYFDLVVQFYLDYWYNILTFAEVKNQKTIESYHLTDKIVFSCDLVTKTARIEITKATIK